MKPIKILCDIQHWEFSKWAREKFHNLSLDINRQVKLEICGGGELRPILKKDPSYDLTFVHLGSGASNKFIRSFESFRRFYAGLLIAESSMFEGNPEATDFILNYFDAYISFNLRNYEPIREVLEQYRII